MLREKNVGCALLLGAFLIAATLFRLDAAHAMSVQPVVIDMAVTGKDSKVSIRVVNDGTKPLPVEFQIYRIELDEKGEKFQKPAGDEFLVFPPQAMVPAGATQVFRVQWVGEPNLKASQSYIFSVNQVPVKMPKSQSGVQIVLNFGVVVNVAPPGGHAVLESVKAEIGKDARGKMRPAIVVENSGNMHAYLSEGNLELDGGSWRKSLPSSDLRQLIGLGLVQPGKQRRFLLPLDLPPGVTHLSARLDYTPKTAK